MIIHRASIKAIFIFLGLLLISGQVLAKNKYGKVTDEEWATEAPADYPEANAVILFDLGSVEINMDQIRFERHVRIRILNQNGIEEVGDIEFLLRENDKLRSVKAQTISPDGKKYKVNKKDILEKSVDNYIIMTIPFPNLEAGSIIEYEYSYANERSWHVEPWYFQSDIYTLYSEYKLHIWPGLIFNAVTSYLNPSEKDPETVEQIDINNPLGQKHQISTWRVTNRVPIKDEPYMSFLENYMASLRIQLIAFDTKGTNMKFATSWSEIGERWQKHLDEYLNASAEVKELAESLTVGITDDHKKVELLHSYVRDNYSNKSSTGSHFANDHLNQLLKLKTGSQREKNVLLTELIKAIDIPAWNILVVTRDKGIFDPQIIQSMQFNHIITLAEIDKYYFYMDAGYKFYPYDMLPINSRTTGGLRIDGDNSDPVRMIFEASESYRRDFTRMFVKSDGQAVCTTTVKCYGYEASRLANLFDEEDTDDIIKERFKDRLGVTFKYDPPEYGYDDSSRIFNLKLTYTLEDYGRKIENNLIIKPIQFEHRTNPFKNEKRFFPVDFKFPSDYYNTVEIKCEDSILSYELPANTELIFPGSAFSKRYQSIGGNILCELQYSREIPIVLETGYTKLRQFFIDMAETVNEEVIITTVQ